VKTKPLTREAIKVRGINVRVTVRCYGVRTLIIGKEEDNIG
jgi:hypothetical protein